MTLIAFPTIKELTEVVNQKVIGQEKLVSKVILCIYKHILKIKGMQSNSLDNPQNNLLIIGDTGTGKTFAVKEVCKQLNLPLIEINCKSISQEGWSGTSFIEIIHRQSINNNNPLKSYTVVFLDEFDKICCPNMSSVNDDLAFHLQSGLLKYIEGMKITYKNDKTKAVITYDTTKFCFILCGSFSNMFNNIPTAIGFNTTVGILDEQELYTQLLNYGVIEEILGRITSIVQTNPFSRRMYTDLLCSDTFIINQWFRYLRSLDLNSVDKINYAAIITEAEKLKLGARGLIQLMYKYVDNIIENGDNANIYNILIPGGDFNE